MIVIVWICLKRKDVEVLIGKWTCGQDQPTISPLEVNRSSASPTKSGVSPTKSGEIFSVM